MAEERNADLPIPRLDPFLPEIAQDLVHFKVEVDRTRCSAVPPHLSARLDELETDGVEFSFDQIIAHAGIELAGSVQDHWRRGEPLARIKRVWDDLSQWRPRSELHRPTGKRRLVVTPPANPNEALVGTRRLGVGVGLLTATRLYGIPYRFWRATGFELHDLEAPAPGGGIIKVEVRARVDRNHWKEARDAIYKKFPPPADFNSAAGILFAPRTTLRRSAADILIMDPEGNNMTSADSHRLRALVEHYIPFFEHQGGWPPSAKFARRLRQLADAEEAHFQAYLANGDDILRAQKPYRIRFWFGAHEFQGGAWYGAAWPEAMTGIVAEPGQGAFYWTLWDEVIKALQDGRIQELAEMSIRPGSHRSGDRVFVLLDDGTAFAWAPSAEALTPRMFEESGDRTAEPIALTGS